VLSFSNELTVGLRETGVRAKALDEGMRREWRHLNALGERAALRAEKAKSNEPEMVSVVCGIPLHQNRKIDM
jgi:hypothetical protein